MKIFLKNRSLISFTLLTTFLFVGTAGIALADVTIPDTDLPETTVEDVLTRVINWAVGIVAFISALVIIIAGILWITAGGDDAQLGKARKMLIGGVIGLVIALGAYALVRLAVGVIQGGRMSV